MQAELVAKPEEKKKPAKPRPDTFGTEAGIHPEHQAATSLPRFLGARVQTKAIVPSPVLQPNLTINSPGDVYEEDADQVAEQVMRMPEPNPGAASVSGAAAGVQPKCACGGVCEKCQAKDQAEIDERLQKKSAATGSASLTMAPPIVHQVLRSPGQPLDTGSRSFMEGRFGQDFSGVRVHTDAKAAESAAAVQARAYTVGHNIVFGGKESASDLPVLAHELAHVVQQSGASPMLQRLESCADFLELVRRPGVGEHRVRDSLAGDAALFGTVETELVIPAGSAAPWRTEPRSGRSDRVIFPQIIGGMAGEGQADVGLLRGSTLEVLEVKEATWDGGLFAEWQLSNYLSKAEDRPDLVTENWRARGNPVDEIKSVEAMPMTRLSLMPNPRVISGELVSLRWCRDGVIVFKVTDHEEQPQRQEEPNDRESGQNPTLPEQLLKIGGELALALAAAGLLDIGLALAGTLAAVVTSPLAALAAIIFGIALFWDEIKWVGGKIAEVAKWVFGKIAWIWEKITWLGGKIAELASWVGGKISWLLGQIAAGAKWVGGKLVAGAKWVGGKIASAAESVWDWLFGSDPQPTVPIIDLPVTEDPTHCAMAAHEDAIVKLDADLLFPFNKWILKPEADDPLKAAAAKILPMLGHNDDRVRIEGYTDNVGSLEYNQHLSEQRAGAVADWLVEYGKIPMSIIQIEGYGKTKAQYHDPEGRKKDRRVEIWVKKHGSVEKVCW